MRLPVVLVAAALAVAIILTASLLIAATLRGGEDARVSMPLVAPQPVDNVIAA